MSFVDENGDGIPNGQDPDFVRSQDGSGQKNRNGNGQGKSMKGAGNGSGVGTGSGTGNCDSTGPKGNQKRGGKK
jgi:hypothetical protein